MGEGKAPRLELLQLLPLVLQFQHQVCLTKKMKTVSILLMTLALDAKTPSWMQVIIIMKIGVSFQMKKARVITVMNMVLIQGASTAKMVAKAIIQMRVAIIVGKKVVTIVKKKKKKKVLFRKKSRSLMIMLILLLPI